MRHSSSSVGKRAEAIGEMFQEGVTPTLAELLIDLEEDPALRTAVVAELRRLMGR